VVAWTRRSSSISIVDSGEFRDDLRQELRTGLAPSAAETRRHCDVVAEQLVGKVQLVVRISSGSLSTEARIGARVCPSTP